MKKFLALAAVAMLTLSGCSQEADSSKPKDQPESSPASANPVSESSPSVVGETLKDAVEALDTAGYRADVLTSVPDVLEDVSINQAIEDEFIVQSQSDVPTGYITTIEAEPSDELLNSDLAWVIHCYDDSNVSANGADGYFLSLEGVWSSGYFDEFTTCVVDFAGTEWSPTAKESQVAKIAQEHWGGREESMYAFATAMEACTVERDDATRTRAWATDPLPWLQAGAELCPEAPFHDKLAAWASGEKFTDGNHVVGKDVPAGTYRSSENVSDCYWERSDSKGNRIANDFVTYASAGVVVSVREGETFTAEDECGVWEKQ